MMIAYVILSVFLLTVSFAVYGNYLNGQSSLLLEQAMTEVEERYDSLAEQYLHRLILSDSFSEENIDQVAHEIVKMLTPDIQRLTSVVNRKASNSVEISTQKHRFFKNVDELINLYASQKRKFYGPDMEVLQEAFRTAIVSDLQERSMFLGGGSTNGFLGV